VSGVAATALRSDARRNRETILAATRELFAADGLEIPAREIARAAGIGVGTLYRHFPTREDLIDAVLEDALAEFGAALDAALEDGDPWHGFTSFLEAALALHARNRALMSVVETDAHGRERTQAMRRRLRPLLAELVTRAKATGRLRSDFEPQDVPLVFWAVDRAIELAGDAAWRRQLAFLLDGLRAERATPIGYPALTDEQLKQVGAR
jgi:AcrR family transcriptional regulator